MKVPFVDLKAQYESMRGEIDAAMAGVMEKTAFIRGPYVAGFEQAYAEFYGVKHCVSVANGTDAIYITLKMLGIGEGDEVITTANTWIASSETITQAGAKPVFVDVEEDYYCIDAAKIEAAVTERTKAIVLVHLLGQPADVKAVQAICDAHGLKLVEDCAQSHLATVDGKRVGTFGAAATFSFYPGKNLGAYGDAGAVTTDDDDLAAKVRCYAQHGADRQNKHNHVMEGINSRLDGMQAAVLSAKLPHLEEWTAKRRERAARYTKLLDAGGKVVTPKLRPGCEHVYHVYQVRSERRDALQAHLADNGVASGRHYPVPLPFLDCYRYLGHGEGDFPVASRLAGEILSLPIFPELTDEQMDFVVDLVNGF